MTNYSVSIDTTGARPRRCRTDGCDGVVLERGRCERCIRLIERRYDRHLRRRLNRLGSAANPGDFR